MGLRRLALTLSIVGLLASFVAQDRIAVAEVRKQDQICDASEYQQVEMRQKSRRAKQVPPPSSESE
jgi:hypothetical protein